MTTGRRRGLAIATAVLGLILFGIAVWHTDFSGVIGAPRQFLVGCAWSIAISTAWHLIRTWMWQRCLQQARSFSRLFRVRLAGEAFSYLTLSGIAGDPLKWLMLRDETSARDVAASLIRERIAYLLGTTAILAISAAAAPRLILLPAPWPVVFRSIAIGAGAFTSIALAVIAIRRAHELRRSGWLALGATAAFACMVGEAWAVLRAGGIPVSLAQAVAIESVSRVGTFASVLVPANLGVLELSTYSAAMAIGVPAAAAPLALTRRLRGLLWAGVGLALYHRLQSRRSDAAQGDRDPADPPRALLYIASLPGSQADPFTRVAGLPIAERIVRSARRAGYGTVQLAVAPDYETLYRLLDLRRDAHVVVGPATVDAVAAAERSLRAKAYKPTDAKVARFNRRISLPISLALLRTPITANQVSALLVVVGLVAAWLFSRGDYLSAVAAATLSLAASILDGCDGEVARLKYQESALGCWIETVGDYSYYLAILAGMTVGSVRATGWQWLYPCGAAALAGTLLSFAMLIYLRRQITSGKPERLHAVARERFNARRTWWSRVIWRISFVATRAAMPYGILVVTLAGALPLLVVLWAIGANTYWLSLCLKFRDLLGAGDSARGATYSPQAPPASSL